MKLCVQNGGIYEKFSVDETYRIIKEAGFDCVDYNMDHALTPSQIRSGCHSKWFDGKTDSIREFIAPAKEAMKKYGIQCNQIHAPFPCFTENEEMDKYVLEATKTTMYASGDLGCHYVIVHEGFPPFDRLMSKKEIFDWNIKFYTSLIPAAKENNVIICLENLFSTYKKLGTDKTYAGECASMDEAKHYIETLNKIAGEERFGFCLDIGHLNLMGKRQYNTIMEIKDSLKALHVHDNNGIADQHLFPYNGNIFWDDFIQGLKDAKYKGALSFETFNQIANCDKELVQAQMNLLGEIGRLFIKRIESQT